MQYGLGMNYSDNFENKVIEIRHKTGVTNKTTRTRIYNEMLEQPGITSVALRIKTLRAKKIRKLFGKWNWRRIKSSMSLAVQMIFQN